MKSIFIFLLLSISLHSYGQKLIEDVTFTTSDGIKRLYDIYIPSNLEDCGNPQGQVFDAPLVVYLHGRNPNGLSLTSRIEIKKPEKTWIAKAEIENFYVLLPKAKRYQSTAFTFPKKYIGYWNNGNTNPVDIKYSTLKKTDDSKFIQELTEDIINTKCVDPCRVYISGHSNGGGMAHRMTVDHDNLFTAAGVVANYNHKTPPPGTTTPSPVPTQVILGNLDPHIAAAVGATVPMAPTPTPLFAPGSPLVTAAPNYAYYHNNSTTRVNTPIFISGGLMGFEMTYPPLDPSKDGSYKILFFKGLKHAWPTSRTHALPPLGILVPPSFAHIDATDHFWDFFKNTSSNLPNCATQPAFKTSSSSNTMSSFEQTVETSIAPNPTTGDFSLNFSTVQEQATINIYDATGKLVQQQTVKARNNVQLEIDGPNGFYLLEVRFKDGSNRIHKVVKQQ